MLAPSVDCHGGSGGSRRMRGSNGSSDDVLDIRKERLIAIDSKEEGQAAG